MIQEVGVYRGSFDPPHKGHFEAVSCALQAGMKSVTIIYVDANKFKPFRTDNKTRHELLKTMFTGMQNVILVEKSYKATVMELESDPTISKIHLIVGSDLLDKPKRPIPLPTKLSYFIISRRDYPVLKPIQTWNNLPVQMGDVEKLIEQHHSSSQIRSLLDERNFQAATSGLPANILDYILSKHFYVPTDSEYLHRALIQKVKKIVEEEIVVKNIVPQENYPLTFHLGSDIGISGLSGDLVCFVKDNEGKICLVIKIFQGNDFKNHYESELLGYDTLSQLKLTLVKVPKLFFSHQIENFAFIGMSFAKGKSLAHLMHDHPEAIRLCARANLELHVSQRSAGIKIKADQLTVFERAIEKVINKLSSIQTAFLPHDIVKQLKLRWIEIHNFFEENPGQFSFTHGDPNHSNWIVDLDSNSVTYIDLSLFRRSISPEKTPFGFAINELTESLVTFRLAAKQIGGISKEKICEMQTLYKEEYLKGAPADITTPNAKLYFASYWILRVIDNLLDKLAKSDSDDLKLKYQTHLIAEIERFINNKE